MARLVNMRPDSEVEPHLQAHLDKLRRKNRSARTLRERRLTVLRLARNLGHPVAEVTKEELAAWQEHETTKTKPLQPASMHNAIVHVGQYLAWLVTAEVRTDNPTDALDRPENVHNRLPHPMDEADITRALAAAGQPEHVWIGLGASCGLRCMEMAALSYEDIRGGIEPHLRIIGKGNKERIVPLPTALRDELLTGPFNRSGHLFDRMDGGEGPPSATRVSERINKLLHSVGISHTAHALRHRYGTKLYEATRDPFYVAQVMGHASTDTTRGYVQLLSGHRSIIEALSVTAA